VKKRIALKAFLTSSGVLIFFIILGELILNAIDIPLPTFQIAGGIVLFLFALTMIFGESKPDEDIAHINKDDDLAVFPLAMPSLASPGAIMAAILLTDNSRFSLTEQAITAAIMLVVLFIAWIFMRFSGMINNWMGNSGASIISRVMGLILTAVAVDNVLTGLQEYIKFP
jgi:multiple antibiotic resistance protein